MPAFTGHGRCHGFRCGARPRADPRDCVVTRTARWPSRQGVSDRPVGLFDRVRGVTVDGRLARGERTRTSVLDAAVQLASVEGLDGLSLSQLAQRLPVSKSALFAHWASKE